MSGEKDEISATDVQSYEKLAGKPAAWVYFSDNWYKGRGFPLATGSIGQDLAAVYSTRMSRFLGLLVGVYSLVIIAIFHPIVIRSEYLFGKKIWPVFLACGLASLGLSVLVRSTVPSVMLGILGFTFLWSIRELFEQEERVRQGRFPSNPKRKHSAQGGNHA